MTDLFARWKAQINRGKTERERKQDNKVENEVKQETTQEATMEVKQETNTEEKKEDFLLHQIDEFREKAKQLQSLLSLKETKVQELQTLVNEKEDQAQELEQIITERREESDRIVVEFDKQISGMIDLISDKLNELEKSAKAQLETSQKNNEELATQNKIALEAQITLHKTALDAQMEANQKYVKEQMDAAETFSREQIAAVRELMNTQAEESKTRQAEQADEVQKLLENVSERLDFMRNELMEKVHSENVKCYRNIQDLFKEFEEKLNTLETVEKHTTAARGYLKALAWFSGVQFIVLVGFILYSLGIF